MAKKREDGVPETVQVYRGVLIDNYHRVVHDLACNCERADVNRALRALAAADWSVLELCNAWYDWWMSA